MRKTKVKRHLRKINGKLVPVRQHRRKLKKGESKLIKRFIFKDEDYEEIEDYYKKKYGGNNVFIFDGIFSKRDGKEGNNAKILIENFEEYEENDS